MSNSTEIEEEKIRKFLNDFTQNPKKLFSGMFNNFHKFSIHSIGYDKSRLIRYVLGSLKNFKILDRPLEKVNWEIPFYYKNVLCSVAHEKFGFRIYIDRRQDKIVAEDIFKEIESKIGEAISNSEAIIRLSAEIELRRGYVIVNNRLHEIEDMYKFFKKKALGRLKKAEPIKAISLKTTSKNFNTSLKASKESKYYEESAYLAFFSLIEHLCVLALAFTNNTYRNNLLGFTKLKWHEKFKMVFDINNPVIKKYYDYLRDLAKFRRNAVAHGYLDASYTSFSFYFEPAAHRIPVSIYDGEVLSKWKDIEVNVSQLDDFLKFIRNFKTTVNMMRYVDTSFDISFDKDGLLEYQTINALSRKEMDDYLELSIRRSDDYANMDW